METSDVTRTIQSRASLKRSRKQVSRRDDYTQEDEDRCIDAPPGTRNGGGSSGMSRRSGMKGVYHVLSGTAPCHGDPTMPTRLFLSLLPLDDEPFVWRLYEGLKAAGFEVWFDASRALAGTLLFPGDRGRHHGARPPGAGGGSKRGGLGLRHARMAIRVPPGREVRQPDRPAERRGRGGQAHRRLQPDPRGSARAARRGFPDDAQFDLHMQNLVRQLSDPLPPIGKLVAVPDLPPNYIEQRDRLANLRDMLLADLRKPVVVTGDAGRVGLQGMGGIGKSVLACALARRPEIRRAFRTGSCG